VSRGRSRARVALLAGALAAGAVAADSPAWQAKVHPRVVQDAAAQGTVEFLILLEERADLSATAAAPTREERGQRVVALLTAVASRTQAPLLSWLEQQGIEHRSFWITNMIWARGGLDVVRALAERTDVRRIDANPRVRLQEPVAEPAAGSADGRWAATTEWGIDTTNADELWALGFDGSGIVVGGQDTGYQWNHPALIAQYRGWNGSSASHAYNWHDAIHAGGGGVCGVDSTAPCDDHGHGTHTMGSAVGDDGGANQIGMAPGAKWMGCRNMNQGDGTPASYTECFQFFVAPTNLAGTAPDPSKAPHVINNSWLCPPSEGCAHDTLQGVVENTRAAGIVVVASAGNSGSACGTIDSPPALYDAALSVGATDSSDTIAGFSSRGPVTVDGSNRQKPDVSAPGVNVRSSVPGNGYAVFSGTSMAGPHVAGLVALLLDARPDLIGQVETVEELLRLSAKPLTSTQSCGGIPGSAVPNAVYGYGRIDALAAVLGDADGDGTDNLADCAPTNGLVSDLPGPAVGLRVSENVLVTGLFWDPPAGSPDGTVRYDVLRSTGPHDFASATCIASGIAPTTTFDVEEPALAFYYLVRASNECGGNLGAASDGSPRTGRDCP